MGSYFLGSRSVAIGPGGSPVPMRVSLALSRSFMMCCKKSSHGSPSHLLSISHRDPCPTCRSTRNIHSHGTKEEPQVSRRGGLERSGVACHPDAIDKEVEYKDSWSDIAFIALCRLAYGNIAGWQSSRSWTMGDETFKGMVEVSRALMRTRSAQEQRDAVISGFPEIPDWFRKLFPYSKWGAEVNAW